MMPSPYDYSITELDVKHYVTNQSTHRRCNLLFSISTDYLNGVYKEQVYLFNILCKLWRANTLVEQVHDTLGFVHDLVAGISFVRFIIKLYLNVYCEHIC